MKEPVIKKKFRCFLLADGKSFTMKIQHWSDTLPVKDLDDQIKFYTAMRDRKDGKYSKDYAPTVEALQKLKRRIAERNAK